MANLKVGDRVRYSSEFCRTIGAVTGFTTQAHGTIVRIWGGDGDFAEIRWDFKGPNGSDRGCAHLSALQKLRK